MNQTEEFRRQSPPPLAPRPLNLPTPQETTLDNGLRIVIVEDSRLPLVSFRLAVRAGNSHDPKHLPGLSDVLATMLTEGTESLTSRELADEVARLGATLAAGSSSDYCTIAASSLASYSDRVLELLAEVALRPTFPENELEIVRQNAEQSLIAQRGQPSFLASERISQVLFGQHPYSVVAPTRESLAATTVEELKSFHRARFSPQAAVLFIVGDVKSDALLERIRALFGAWQSGSAPGENFPAPPERTSRVAYLVDRPNSAQSNIVIANLGINRTHPDYFSLLLMNTVLGANASSRLFMNLREDKGYTYGAYSSLDARRNGGSLRATSEVRTPVTGDSLKEFFYELDRIRNEPVSDKELQDAKSFLTGVFPIRLETQEGLIDQLVQIKMYGLPDDYLQNYRERVSAVTKEDVQRVARQHLTPEKAAIVIVGDAKAIVEQVKPFTEEIEFYTSAGKRKEMSPAGSSRNEVDPTGEWSLTINVPGGSVPATLVVSRNGSHLSGQIESEMGDGKFDEMMLDGTTFGALVVFRMQGQTIEGKVSGDVEGTEINGTIELSIPGAPPLTFSGNK